VSQEIRVVDRIVASVEASGVAITALSEEIRSINTISRSIGEVAEQTNLLALNAAIEAARAGEQGRGFAVVADEGRKLAERAGASARDISTMVAAIGTRTDQVIEAMRQVGTEVGMGKSGSATIGGILAQIVGAAQEVSTVAQNIADATREQQSASTTTAVSMERIAGFANENRSSIHEVSRAAEALADTAAGLRGMVGSFRLQ
jgi:methyl-accepting chemotaxis protein